MSVIIRIPTPLRPMVNGEAELKVDVYTIASIFDTIEKNHPGFKSRICDAEGNIRRFINIYINDTDVRTLMGIKTQLKDGDTLSIIPAVAGGKAQTFQEKLAELKKTQKEVTPEEVKKRIDEKKKCIIIDVRETEEFKKGQIPGAMHIPRGYLELKIESLIPDKNTHIVLHCAGGTRSLLAAETLSQMGYVSCESMSGGFGAWAQRGFPIKEPITLSEKQKARFSRHLSIPEVGEAGQMKLLQSKVLLIGAGGLGSPSAYYLAAAGIGTLGIVDFDVVDESNLQRQILHTADRVGVSKIESARKTIQSFSPDTNIVPFEERLTSTNIERILQGFDIILDGSDNFPTRYLINDACVRLKKPCVHGSVYRFEGQVTVFDPSRGGPCYRCLYPEPPPPEMAPSCADAGVLGVLPGIIGLLQAVEVIKIIISIGKPLIGRLITYDALDTYFKEFKLAKNPACVYCGEGKVFPGYIDYEEFCRTH